MLKDISTIKVKGANFASLTPLTIFESKDGKSKKGIGVFKTVKGSLLYGRNGTGKSTIAKAFRKAKGEAQPAISQVSFFDIDGNPVVLSEEVKKRIFVFDEDFVNEKVKFKDDHLDTIIMIGEAANLAKKIEMAETDRDSAKIIYETRAAALKEFEDTKNPKSPMNRLLKICDALRGDDAWAGRDRKINGGRQNTKVKDETYKEFVNLEPTMTQSALIIEFDNQMKALEVANSGFSKIDTEVPALPKSFNQYDDDTIMTLLSKKIEKPVLSEREQYLMSLVEAEKAKELSQKAIFFRNPNVKECPYCFQTVSNEYKSNLVDSIEKVLSKTVMDHQKALEDCMQEDVIINLSDFSMLQSYEVCVALIEKINKAIQETNKLLQKKIENPYNPIVSFNLDVALDIKQLNEALGNFISQLEEGIPESQFASDVLDLFDRINTAYGKLEDISIFYEDELEIDEIECSELVHRLSGLVGCENNPTVENLLLILDWIDERKRKCEVIDACLPDYIRSGEDVEFWDINRNRYLFSLDRLDYLTPGNGETDSIDIRIIDGKKEIVATGTIDITYGFIEEDPFDGIGDGCAEDIDYNTSQITDKLKEICEDWEAFIEENSQTVTAIKGALNM